MTESAPTTCNHERRPGTTVCLQCRNESALLARSRFLRVVLVGAGVGGMVLAAAWVAVGPVLPGASATEGAMSTAPAAHVVTAPAGMEMPASPAEPEVAEASDPVRLAPSMVPVVANGRTTLADDVTVERDGPMVTVHFDTELARTRRPEKFDRIVRATLPIVYGVEAESLLAEVPEGMLAANGDLLSELPDRGVRLPLSGGWQLVVWPETRQGRDGPLVVSYRTAVQR